MRQLCGCNVWVQVPAMQRSDVQLMPSSEQPELLAAVVQALALTLGWHDWQLFAGLRAPAA
jgi:hypothetical protein